MVAYDIYGFGATFANIGVMVVMFVFAYVVYQFARCFKAMSDNEIRYIAIENVMLNRICEKKGINLDKEMLKQGIFKQRRKSLESKLKEEIYNELFGNEEKNGKAKAK